MGRYCFYYFSINSRHNTSFKNFSSSIVIFFFCSLDLSSIQIRNCRVEHYQTDRQIDMVVTRAVSGIDELVDKICHFVSKDCRILFMKGMASKEDISSLPQDFEVVNVDELKILGRTRHVIEIGRK